MTVEGKLTIAERWHHDLRDVGAGELDGVLEQVPRGLGQLGLDVLGFSSLLGGNLHLDARRPGAVLADSPASRSVRDSRPGAAPASAARPLSRMAEAAGQKASDDRLGEHLAQDPGQHIAQAADHQDHEHQELQRTAARASGPAPRRSGRPATDR